MAGLRTALGSSFVLGALIIGGCGSDAGDSEFGKGAGTDNDGSGDNGGGLINGNGDGGTGTPACEGLQCKQVACAGGGTTSLSGKVYIPSGTVPLYNAVVYVPNAPVDAFTEGVTCDQCGTAPSGKPITTAITNAKGEFTLNNVPVGVDIPLVIQIGRWRRQITVPAVQQCTNTPLDAGLTRLPRNKAEGDIPKIAITTGNADSLECFLRKLGIEDAEITNPSGAGRVHLYQGKRSNADGSYIDGSTPSGQSLWDDAAKLKNYDMVILSCEGSTNTSTKSNTARGNLKGYLDAGGRVFASHYHYTWFREMNKEGGSTPANPLAVTANWNSGSDIASADMSVDTSFAKGQAFSEWLVEAGASTTAGVVPGTELRTNVLEVPAPGAPAETSRRWLSVADQTKFFSFNAPLGLPAEQQCGRGVYTDIHVSTDDESSGTFPQNCTGSKDLSPQEKALLFLLMDLSSCIQDDSKPPEAPPPVVK